MNSLGSYSGVYSNICLLRELMLKELAVDLAKLLDFSIDYLVRTIHISLIDDMRSLPFGN